MDGLSEKRRKKARLVMTAISQSNALATTALMAPMGSASNRAAASAYPCENPPVESIDSVAV